MPAVTPNYMIEYPCASDTLDPAAFGTWANDIETAIETVQARAEFARLSPRTVVTGTTLAVPSGVLTTLNHATTLVADARITNGAIVLTFTVGGVYMLNAQLEFPNGSAATAIQATITGPGTQVIQRDLAITPGAALRLNVSGLFVIQAAQTAVFSVLHSSGAALDVVLLGSAEFVCEV